jgi:S1-C subfamily serine protease
VGPQVTDEWIESIRDMQSLNIVVIQDAQITDRSMEVISGLKAVVSLDLMYAPVTDRGFALLKRMPSLRQVRCFGTQVTPAAAERFRVEFANVDVQHKMGAFLGVRCVQPPFACAVSSVTSQSAAEKAGIRSNDIIVEFDKQPVRDFEDLQQLIGVRKVGDTVEIRVARCEADPVELGVAQQSLEDLGVELQSNNIGLLVQQVQAGKGAMRAGLKVGDVIATLDDVRLTDVDQWQKLFQQPPGNPLPEAGFRRLEILRGIKYIKLKVVFGAWDTGL